MKSKSRKNQELNLLKKKLPDSKLTIFTSFSRAGEKGLSVAQMTELKRLLRSIGSEYMVIKKTLVDIALKDRKYDGLDIFSMEGSIGLVMAKDDPYGVAKKIYEFSRKNPALNFWGAVMDSKFLGKESFMEIAKLPSRDILLGRLVGMLTYPMRGLAVALSEISKQKS